MLYVEKDPRLIVDPATVPVTEVQLKPSNVITEKLWRVVESLRDIDNLLDDIVTMSDISKKRRRMKILATPLYSFYQSIRNVKNYYESEKEYKHHASKKHIKETWERISPEIDTHRLKTMRDKLSGHVDKKLSFEQVERIVQEMSHFDIAVWIHACILILFELLDLQVYGWYTDDAPKNRIRLMVAEAVLVTINQEHGHPGYIEEVTFTQSPKHQIELICQKIVENTQWVFQEAIDSGYVVQG
jgi:hypothetical protein